MTVCKGLQPLSLLLVEHGLDFPLKELLKGTCTLNRGPTVILSTWLCLWKPHPSSLDPNRRKAIGVPGGGDAVWGGAPKGELRFECVGPMQCQSVQQRCLGPAVLGLLLSGSHDRHPGLHHGQVKRQSPHRWLHWLFSQGKLEPWDAQLFLSSNYLIHRICLVKMHIDFSGSASSSVQILHAICLVVSFALSHYLKELLCTMYWLVLRFILQLDLICGNNLNTANVLETQIMKRK